MADDAYAWLQLRTGPRHGAFPVDIYVIGGTHMKEKKDPATLEAFFSLVLLLFFLYNPRFPFVYKRERRAPLSRDPDRR